jgi:hypothetical protein
MADENIWKTRRTVVIPIGEDGRADLSAMRPSTREKLKAALSDPKILTDIGIIQAGDDAFQVPDEMAEGLGAAFGFIAHGLMSLAIPRDRRKEFREDAKFSDDEQKRVGIALGSVVAKYAGPAIVNYSPEVAAGGTILDVEGERFRKLGEYRNGKPRANLSVVPPQTTTGVPAEPIVKVQPKADMAQPEVPIGESLDNFEMSEI